MLSETDGALTQTPQNVLVLRGQDAILNCATNSTPPNGRNPIVWIYDGNTISHSPCTAQSPGFVASPPDSATYCNLRAEAWNKDGISGAYRCGDYSVRASPTAQAVATVIVLGKLHQLFSSR